MRVLLWAIVLLTVVCFVLGIMMRQTMGQWCNPEMVQFENLCREPHLERYGEMLFSTLSRSCLTVFRCFTDGCSAPDGTPLMVHIFEDSSYGQVIVFIYVLSFLFVTFGLFNLIMAIFVENTMESARFDERKRQQLRHMQAVQMAQQLQKLVLKFCTSTQSRRDVTSKVTDVSTTWKPIGLRNRFKKILDTLRGKVSTAEELELQPIGLDVEITRDKFSEVFADQSVSKLLDNLEVAVNDPMDLFDTLDADSSGSIDVSELIRGLMKLRGTAEKSDMVACLLAVRAIQKSITSFEVRLTQSHGSVLEVQEKMETQLSLLDRCLQKVVPGFREEMKSGVDALSMSRKKN